ncbi:MAG: hypothetical protein AAFU64_15430 [Bacteroidota bacterium]
MKKLLFTLILSFGFSLGLWAQPVVSTEPASFTAEDEITLTVDVTGTSLAGHTGDVWIWAWISEGCSADCDAPTNINPATPDQDAAKMSRSESNPDVYTITFVPTSFYGKAPSELVRLGFKLKSADWGDGKQSDNDAFLDVDPLEFVPAVNRVFPSKVTQDDAVSLYLDQTLAETQELQFATGDFSVEIKAYDANGNELDSMQKDATNQGSGGHLVRIIPIGIIGFDLHAEVTRGKL